MGERKNIDRLFQEQFKDFEQVPDNRIWENIEKELLESQPNEEDKVYPFIWYKWIGIAASIILLIGLSVNYFSEGHSDDNTLPAVVDDGDDSELKNNIKSKDAIRFNDDSENFNSNSSRDKEIANTNNIDLINNEGKEVDNHLSNEIIDIGNEKSYVVENSSNKDVFVDNNKAKNINESFEIRNKKEEVVTYNGSNKTLIENTQNNRLREINNGNSIKEAVSINKEKNKLSTNGLDNNSISTVKSLNNSVSIRSDNLVNNNTSKDVLVNNKSEAEKSKENIVSVNKYEDSGQKLNSSTVIADNLGSNVENGNQTEKKEPISEVNKELLVKNNLESNEKEIEEKIVAEENKEEEILPSIEEAIANQEDNQEDLEEENEEEEVYNKWDLRPNIAPVYYNSLSSGSPIDEEFKNNKKKGDVNMSYGINVSYALNKRLKLRSGINRVELGYQTQNVAVIPIQEGEVADYIKNISVVSEASHLNISSAEGFSVSQIPSSFQNLFDARIDQKFGYLEVPLEMSYQLSSKKLSVNLIAGMSTFFLNKNEVHATTNSYTAYLGEANNLNKTVFSTNLGVGFNYSLSKSFSLNVEPTFKYQLNSFSSDAGNFKPYLLGVYSGLSFKF